MSRFRALGLFVLFAITPAFVCLAQDSGEIDPLSGAETVWAGASEVLALDIAGSGYYELIAWVRSLGLPESGGAEELRRRLYAHYGVSAPQSESSGTRIRIEAADRTEYFKLETMGEEYIRLTGGVALVFTEGDSGETHRIRADEILYNRTKNIISARGGVVYEKTGPSGVETFYGSSITVDLDSWQGRFLDGRSVRSSGDDAEESKLVFAAEEIRKLENGVLALRDGLITSSEAEDPYWSVRASRIWLLGSNEWAIANAVLSVGNVPVLYLPFFYYPGQEIVFHPAIGYRAREGRFVQTTTYLIGEKTATAEDELNLFKTSSSGPGYEKELRGVFLRDSNIPKSQGSKDTLKILADVYSNLGAFLGLEGVFEAKGVFQNIQFSAGLGLSRSLFYDSGYYTPFSDAGGNESVWNGSFLWGLALPFRYALSIEAKLAEGPWTANVSLPLRSDAYFDEDFRVRSEDMNWLKIMTGETSQTDPGETTSFTQSVSVSANFPLEKAKPWINSFALEKFYTSLYWKPLLRTTPLDPDEATLFAVDPLRKFFAPELFTIADIKLSLRGDLYAFPQGSSGAGGADGGEPMSGGSGNGSKPEISGASAEELAAPWVAPGSEGDTRIADTEASEVTARTAGDSALSGTVFLPPPPSAAPSSGPSEGAAPAGGISYAVSPSVQYERRYPTAYWDEPEDVDGGGLYDLATYSLSATLEAKAAWASNLLASSFLLSWTSQAQFRSRIDSDITHVSDAQADAWELQDARYRYERLTGTLKLSSSPFQDVWFFSPTSLSYTVVGYLYGTSYQEDSITNFGAPIYDVTGLEWTTDSIKTHALALTLGVQPYGYVQSLTLSSTLPPRLESYGFDAKFSVPFVSLQGTTKYYRSTALASLRWDALTLRLNAGLPGGPGLTDQFVWNVEDQEPASNTATFTWGGFQASLLANRSKAYDLSLASGWQTVGSEAFRLTQVSASYKKEVDLPLFRKGDIRLKGSLDAAFSQSLLKATESVLALTYGISFSVPGLLDVNVSGTSQNSSVWRYAPSWFGMSDVDGITFEPVNVFEDLWNSVSIWNRASLEKALFKLKGLSVKATHYMEDWDLVFEYKGGPELNTSISPYTYEFVSSFSLLLTWKALPQITTSVLKDSDGLRTE